MAVTLESVVLPDLIIENEFAWTGVSAEVARTLAQNLIIWEEEKTGKPLDLVGDYLHGWITRETLNEILELSKVTGASYELQYETDLYVVRFRHEDPPVIEASPLIPRPNQGGTDYYSNVRLKFMVLE